MDKNNICSNCSNHDHDYKHCSEPITSWGIILVKHDLVYQNTSTSSLPKTLENKIGVRINSSHELKTVCSLMNQIKFLLIRRKHSLGYVEFIRGRYVKDNINGIIYLFQQMTPDEILKLKTMDNFEDIWCDFWNEPNRKFISKREYIESKQKFDDLKNKIDVELGLDFYVNNVKPFYMYPEWGYPKGRKKKGETDLECATREFCEETGYKKEDIKIVNDVVPIVENMIGTNGVSYRHIYYLAEDISNNVISKENITSNEIGDIHFFTYEETEQILREYHIEKRNITKNILFYYVDKLTHFNEIIEQRPEPWSTETDLI